MTDDIVRNTSTAAAASDFGDGGQVAARYSTSSPYHRQLPADVTAVKMANQQLYRNGGGTRHNHGPSQQTHVGLQGGSSSKTHVRNGKPSLQFTVRHQHMIRLIGQFLTRCGLEGTANSLVRESGLRVEEDIACRLRQSILAGKWQEAEKHLLMLKPYIIVNSVPIAGFGLEVSSAQINAAGRQVLSAACTQSAMSELDDEAGTGESVKAGHQDTLLKKMYFLLRERKFLELLDASCILDALLVLRNEISTLNVEMDRMHELAMRLMMPLTSLSSSTIARASTPKTPATTLNGATSNGCTESNGNKARTSRHARYRAAANNTNKTSSMANGNSITPADGGSLDGCSASTSENETDGTEVDGVMHVEEDGGGDASSFFRRTSNDQKVEPAQSTHSKAREELINVLQTFLPPGIMLPPDRLEVLIDQAVAFQMQKCALHDCAFMSHDDSNDTEDIRSTIVTNGSLHTRHAAGGGSRSSMLRRPGIRRSYNMNGHNDQIQNGSVPDGSNNNSHRYQALPQSVVAAALNEDDAVTSVNDEDDGEAFGSLDDAENPALRNVGNGFSHDSRTLRHSNTGFSRSYGLLADHVCQEADFPAACIQTLRDHTDEVWFARFSHNGKYLATASRDGRVLVYAVDLHATLMARRLHTFDVARDSNTAMSSVAFLAWSPDDRFLAACGPESSASNVLIWSMEQGILRSRINRTAEDALTCVAWRKCSRRLVMGGTRGQFYYSDLDGASLAAWDGIRVQALAYGGVGLGRFFQPLRSASSSILADGAVDDSSVLAAPIDPGYGMGHSDGGNDNDPAADGSAAVADSVGLSDCYVLAADTHYRVRVYNFDAVPQPRDVALIQEDHPIISFSCNSSGRRALLNVADQSLRVWDLYDRSLVRKYRGAQEGKFTVHSCFGGSREQFIASGSEDKHVYIWHIDNSEPVQVLRAHTGIVNCVHWNKAQPMLVASASDDHTVRLWAPRRFVNEAASSLAQQSGDEPMLADELMMPSTSASSDNVAGAQSGGDGSGSALPPPPPAAGGGANTGTGIRFSGNPYSGSGGTGGSRSIGQLFRRGLLGSHGGSAAAGSSSDLQHLLFIPNDPTSSSAVESTAAAALMTGYGGGLSGANMPYADSGAAALVAAGFSGSGAGGGSGNNPGEQQGIAGDASGAFPDLRTPSSLFHRVITPTLAAANTRRNNALARDLAALNAAANAASSSSGSGRGAGTQQQQREDHYHLYPGGTTGGAGRGSSAATLPSGASRLLQLAFQQHETSSSTQSSRHQQQQQQQQMVQDSSPSAAWAASLMPPLESISNNPSASETGSSSMMSTLQNLVMAHSNSAAAAAAALRRSATLGSATVAQSSASLAAPYAQRYQQLLAAAAGSGTDTSSGVPPSIRFREAFGGERFGSGSSSTMTQQQQQASNEAVVSAALAGILGSVESAAASGGGSSSSAAALPSFVHRYAGSLQSPHADNSSSGGNTSGALNFSLLNASSMSSGSAASHQQPQHAGQPILGDDDDDEDDESGPTNVSAANLFGNPAAAAAVAAAVDAGDDDDDDTDDEDNDNADAMHDAGAHLMNFFGVANLDYEDDDDDGDSDDEDDENDEDDDDGDNEEGAEQQNEDSNASGGAGSAQQNTPAAAPPPASAGAATRRSTRGGGGGGSSGGGASQHRSDERSTQR